MKTVLFSKLCSTSIFLVIIGLGTSCGESSGNGTPWDVGEENQDLAVMSHGFYDVDIDIVEDGCSPSLEEVFQSRDGWPPPIVPIGVHDQEPVGMNIVRIPFVWTRAAHFRIQDEWLDEELKPYSRLFMEDAWPSLEGFSSVTCPYPLYETPYQTRLEVHQLDAETMEAKVQSDFGDLDECVDRRTRERYAAIPDESCSEAYTITFRLRQACAEGCLYEEGGSWHLTNEDGYQIAKYNAAVECTCDGE